MKSVRLFILQALTVASISLSSAQQEIGYTETFALAGDREEALRQLIPGTEDYYYYHALHYQNTGQIKPYDETVSQWEKRFTKSQLRGQIHRRQILLNYGSDPKGSLDDLRRELDLKFDHQQEGKARAKQYPSTLDQDTIGWNRFLEDALKEPKHLQSLTQAAFFPLLESKHELSAAQRRDLLSRTTLPDLPGLVELIADELRTKESKGFGALEIHQSLTTAQLDELRRLIPGLIRDEPFVLTRLSRLRPGADINLITDTEAKRAYLKRAWKFVKDLTPSFNSLKAHILYQQLRLDYAGGTPDPALFLTYLKLPRNAPYILSQWRRNEKEVWLNPADCNRDFIRFTGFSPIGADQPLVRDYLLHFLKRADNYDAYAPYVSLTWLKAVFAETKIVNGIGDPERWASYLAPAAFQKIKDRVDVEFDAVFHGDKATNILEHSPADEVMLRLHVKNVDKLIVKVFEINPLNYYLENNRELSTDLPLDGLVANHERSFEYEEPPSRRVTRDFKFPEIGNRRGVWVVEFIGGSRSSRAVIRKGKLEAFARTIPSGSSIQVLDSTHQPVKNAAVWLGERRFACDEKGRTLIPFSTNPGQQTLILEDSKGYAYRAPFRRLGENYTLRAGFHVERESLRPGAQATLAVRPTLTVAGQPISLKTLDDVQLVLTSTDLDGIATTTTIDDFKIESDREALHQFRVPDRIASLDARLVAKVLVRSHGNRQIEVSDSTKLLLNKELSSARVDDLYLSRIDGRYILELIGRSGEARGGRNLNLTFQRKGFLNTLSTTLKTDEGGSIDLGPLDGISHILASTADGHQRDWEMSEDRRTLPAVINSVSGSTVSIPYMGRLDRQSVALFEVSGKGYAADRFDRLALKNGFLIASKLTRGDYRLFLKSSQQSLTLRVAEGETSGRYVFNAARTLELPKRPSAQLTKVEPVGDHLEIEVANADPLTRVHVLVTRFLPDFDVFTELGSTTKPELFAGRPSYLPNLYLSGRKIGDEFRYILERRYGTKLPGNMLERPEILLNPWAIQDTEAGAEQLAKGEAYKRKAPGAAAQGGARAAKIPSVTPLTEDSPRSIDFLARPPVELFNLRPDDDGSIRLELESLGDRQHVHVMLIDPSGASYEQLSLPARNTKIRDLRLIDALDPARHFTEQDSVTLLKAGDKLVIPDLLTARFESFDHLDAAYRYLLALRDDPTLREFDFITRWEKLSAEEKRAKYSKYACHELSFFLARKDPEFFKQTILPHLSNKRDRTFLDDYLLENDLNGYFEPFEYGRLNVPERILLSQRHPAHLSGIRLDLRDRLSLIPPDLALAGRFFDGALSSFGLSAGGGIQLGAKLQMESTSNFSSRAVGANSAPAPPLAMPQNASRSYEALSEEKAPPSRRKEAVRYSIDESAVPSDAFAADFEQESLKRLYRAMETTKEWAENNYYHLPIAAHNYQLITESKFWLDYAMHDGQGGFGSRHLGEASRSFPESMIALALLDLPFTSPDSKTSVEGAEMTYTAGGPSIVFHREIRDAELADDGPPLLVSQSYFRHDDRFRIENGEKVDKFVTDEFIVGTVYGAQVVVTNPTSSRQKLDILMQIPKGSVAVLGHRATSTKRISMEPYTTQRFELAFYFPSVGDYPCYPAHVSKEAEVVAHADAFTFEVVDKPSKVDESSWAYLSQWGTSDQVLEYLKTGNLHAVELPKIAWRFREDADFMKQALAELDRRGIYDGTLFSYAILHDDAASIRDYLMMQGEYLGSCGLYLNSKLVTIDPIDRRAYQHLEYRPLINNRAHQVGERRKILNQRILGQYQQFMQVLSQKSDFDSDDLLSLVYYLFLQDRTDEALARLDEVDVATLPTKLQYDYFRSYAAFYRSEPSAARDIASRYSDYPVDRWRQRFEAIIAQADEIDGKSPVVSDDKNREQVQADQAAKEASLQLKVEGTEVVLAIRKLSEVRVNYYEMDLEFLFSANPFVASGDGGFSIIQPNQSETVAIQKGSREHRFSLPRKYQSKNVLVEVTGGGKKRSKAIFANELQTAVSENFGILGVRHAKDDRPLSKVYVKVYAMTSSGPVFYKDGYTDLRGKFDYASVSTSNISDVSKFSILIMSDQDGASVLEAPAPQR